MFSLLWLACSGVMLVDKGVGVWLFVCLFFLNGTVAFLRGRMVFGLEQCFCSVPGTIVMLLPLLEEEFMFVTSVCSSLQFLSPDCCCGPEHGTPLCLGKDGQLSEAHDCILF